MHTKCRFIHCPINYLLTFWVVLVFHLRVGIVFHPTLFTASTWNTKTPVLQSDLRQRMDQYQPLWQFCCLCLRRNIGFIKKFPQLKAESFQGKEGWYLISTWFGCGDLEAFWDPDNFITDWSQWPGSSCQIFMHFQWASAVALWSQVQNLWSNSTKAK